MKLTVFSSICRPCGNHVLAMCYVARSEPLSQLLLRCRGAESRFYALWLDRSRGRVGWPAHGHLCLRNASSRDFRIREIDLNIPGEMQNGRFAEVGLLHNHLR